MLESQDEWMSDDELNHALDYTDGYAMKVNAQFSTSISGLYWNLDQQGFCIGTELYLECAITKKETD